MDLEDLYRAITRRGIDVAGHPFRLIIDDWIRLRDMANDWCKKHDRPLLSDPLIEQANFIWGGVPVVCV